WAWESVEIFYRRNAPTPPEFQSITNHYGFGRRRTRCRWECRVRFARLSQTRRKRQERKRTRQSAASITGRADPTWLYKNSRWDSIGSVAMRKKASSYNIY